eukprot:jgi/Bigna1/130636/aug1.12_g5344
MATEERSFLCDLPARGVLTEIKPRPWELETPVYVSSSVDSAEKYKEVSFNDDDFLVRLLGQKKTEDIRHSRRMKRSNKENEETQTSKRKRKRRKVFSRPVNAKGLKGFVAFMNEGKQNEVNFVDYTSVDHIEFGRLKERNILHLRGYLQKFGLASSGNKAKLISRIQDHRLKMDIEDYRNPNNSNV